MTVRVLTDHVESTAALVEQMRTCQSAAWAIAWVTPNKVFEAALANIVKFRKLVVGTHGCHTSPECLEKLGPLPQVAIRRSGKDFALFHPKLYVFEHSDQFTVVIGSHNLTRGAFQSNVEVSTLTQFSKTDPTALKLLAFVIEQGYEPHCVPYTLHFLKRYQDLHRLARKQRRDVEKLIEDIPDRSVEAQRLAAPIHMSWDGFYNKARHDQAGSLEERLKVLMYIKDLFQRCTDFVDMDPNDHLRVAGLASVEMCESDGVDWNLFGHMKVGDAFGKPYGNLIRDQPDLVSQALAHIPLDRPVTEADWHAYWTGLKGAVPGGKGLGRAGATRLVCMKRPDYFVSVNNRSASNLAVQFGIKASDLNDVDNYWATVIAPMMLTPWWADERPVDPQQAGVWDFRAALVDILVKD